MLLICGFCLVNIDLLGTNACPLLPSDFAPNIGCSPIAVGGGWRMEDEGWVREVRFWSERNGDVEISERFTEILVC